MKNWIMARKLPSGEIVKVRQRFKGGWTFIDESGEMYGIDTLDFTQLSGGSSSTGINDNVSDNHFNDLKEMMKSWDVKEQDNNRALIAEREYWRTLRGDVFRDVFHDVTKKTDCALSMTKCIINALYEQDKVFGNDNFKDGDNA